MCHQLVDDLLSFIQKNPTAFHTVASIKAILQEWNYEELLESGVWKLREGHGFYVCRNDSSIIAFQVGNQLDSYSFNIAASHTDSPVFKLKEKAELKVKDRHTKKDQYTKLNTEGYGGMICSTWLDRPLSVAGRVLVRRGEEISAELIDLDRDLALIPSVAIHMNRAVNDGYAFNKQVDMLPLFAGKEGSRLMSLIAGALSVDEDQILGSDLYLYPRERPAVWGFNREFISSSRLDDQQCTFAALQGFLGAVNDKSINILACFDNEEVGSGTKQGAASTFLSDTLKRINMALGKDEEEYLRALASSFMLSADNAHAVHPNHPEQTDVENCVYMNEGIVVKSHAGQKYASDGMSIAIVKELASRSQMPLQYFSNRSDKNGGSTLGNIAMRHVSVKCADIGLPQLAMHSSYETAGIKDTWYLVQLMKEFYHSHFQETSSGVIQISEQSYCKN